MIIVSLLLLSALACVFVLLLGVSLNANRMRAERDKLMSAYRAARWLAQYNHAYSSAAQDVACTQLKIDYATLRALVNDRVKDQPYYGSIGQLVPIALVPAELRHDADVYNDAVVTCAWPDSYTHRVFAGAESVETARIRQLEDAVDILTEWPSDEAVFARVARKCLLSEHAAYAAAVYLHSEVLTKAKQLLSAPDLDPEQILPKEY